MAVGCRRYTLRMGFCLLVAMLSSIPGNAIAAQSEDASAQKRIVGFVKSGEVPLPGVSVIAVNSATGRQVITSTDVYGSYVLVVSEPGSYELSAQLAAFAPATKTITIDDAHPEAQADFGLTLLSRAPATEPKQLITRGRGPAPGPEAGQNRRLNPGGPNSGRFNQGMNPQLNPGANSEANAGPNRRMNVGANPGGAQRQAQAESGGFLNLPVMEGDNSGQQSDGMAAESAATPETANESAPPDTAAESVSISGATARMEQLPNLGEMRDRMMQEGGQYRGGPGGPPGGGPFGGGGGPMMIMLGGPGGGRGRLNINRPHGSISYTLGDSAFDAKPYSLTGLALPKPSYTQSRYSAAIGGPLNIPKLFHGGRSTFFFFSYDGNRGLNPFDAFSTVPTAAERIGDFSGATILSGQNAGTPVQIFDPSTHLPFPINNVIPQKMLNPASVHLLSYIPLPNLPGDVQNFHRTTSLENDLDNINLRVIHNFGGGGPMVFGPGGRGGGRGRRAGSSINFGFRYHTTGTVLANASPFIGGNTSVQGIDAPVGYVVTKGRLTNNFRVDFNRNRTSTQNLYAFSQNIAGLAGINGVSQNPFDWGLPSLSFTNFSGIRDTTPVLRRDQTFSLGDNVIWTHGQHTIRWGGDFRKIQSNTQTSANARGSFTFTGFNTAGVSNGVPVPGTGYDFADFLLGLPQQTSAQFGNNAYYFRGNSWDLFGQDEWRLKANLTLNLGLRYEYASPYTEKYGRIVNLDAASGFTAVVPVLPGSTGSYTGAYPASLVNPDRNNFAPRLGVAWKPAKNTVVRLGYSINYNVSAYAGIIQNLAFQPPFAFTQTNVESAAVPLTLQNGFPASPASVTNNYGVNRNYRMGYAQMSSFDLQQQLPRGMVLNLTFSHVKGTHLDMLRAPNRGPSGLLIAGVEPFLWESSEANSTSNSISVQVRRRFQHGLLFGGRYIFSKSIDNASSIGGGATVVAQNDLDLAAERGLSSFDQRHRFSGDYVWELPFGTDKRFLNKKGIASDLAGGWQLAGNVTLATGIPFTARILGSFAEVGRGTNGTLRADATGLPVSIDNPTAALYFNTAAFAVPPPGQFGNAARNTIPGPPTISFNGSINKVIRLGETQALELRAQVNNIFNTPQFTSIDTTVNSPSFGRVLNVGSMRKVTFVARYRF